MKKRLNIIKANVQSVANQLLHGAQPSTTRWLPRR